jgi:hypothetical protein
MGRMKEIYTELVSQGLDPAEIAREGLPNGDFEKMPKHLQDLFRDADPNKEFNDAVQQKFQHAKHVLLSKHKDYGPTNISLSPGGPLNGLRVRMHDKMARINHLIDSKQKPEYESLKDSFLDLANYAIIAMLVLDDEWDKRG